MKKVWALFVAIWSFFQVWRAAQIIISPEQGARYGSGTVAEQEQQAREKVDLLRENWENMFHPSRQRETVNFWEGDDEYVSWGPFVLSYSDTTVEVSLRQMDESPLGEHKDSSTYPRLDHSASGNLADGAPVPHSLFGTRIWNENIWNGKRNGLLFEFEEAPWWFWIRVGDLETRTDGMGVPAQVFLLDEQQEVIIQTFVEPDIADQMQCWWPTQSESISWCWNETTRRIWFVAEENEEVKYLLITVWDDDDIFDDDETDALKEHLSFIGPTLVKREEWNDDGICLDTDLDEVCDTHDFCPFDPHKSESVGECWCWVIDPSGLWKVCVSWENACWQSSTWIITCTWCSTSIPDLPTWYGDNCQSVPNNCWEVNYGRIWCDEVCSAVNVPDRDDCDCPNPHPSYKQQCTSEPNSCWEVRYGTILCDGTCSAPISWEETCNKAWEKKTTSSSSATRITKEEESFATSKYFSLSENTQGTDEEVSKDLAVIAPLTYKEERSPLEVKKQISNANDEIVTNQIRKKIENRALVLENKAWQENWWIIADFKAYPASLPDTWSQ